MAMKITPFIQVIKGDSGALIYHSLFGKLFFVEPDYLFVLDNFASLTELQKYKYQQVINDLVSAGYIVDDEVNERDVLAEKNNQWMVRLANGEHLRLLNLMISEACNFGCAHCLHKCSVQTDKTHGIKKIMDWQLAKQVIDKYALILSRAGSHNLNVHFGSAEPLLNWPVLKKAVQYIRDLDSEAHLAVNTNLSLLTFGMAEFFRDNQVYISTSLDGPAPGNNAIRIFANGQGTFDVIVSKFQMLASIGYPLDGFSITLNDLNFDLVNPDFISWAKQMQFSGIATDIDLINTANSQRSVNDCINKLMQLREACQRLGMESFGSWTTAYDNLVNEPEDEMPAFCKAIKGRNISVNPSGSVFICGHTNTLLGEIGDLADIFAQGGDYYNLVVSRLPGNDPWCVDCPIEGVCAGQCQITREVSQNTKNNRHKILCDFYREATRQLLEKKLISESAGN